MNNWKNNFCNKSPFKQRETITVKDEIDGKDWTVTGYETKKGFKPSNKKGHNEKMKEYFGEKPTTTYKIIEKNRKEGKFGSDFEIPKTVSEKKGL